jgi:elongation factor Ts
MNISATQVKDLREKTGAGMMDCKAALIETGGDMEGAIDWLRAKGLAKAAKKAGRVAAEGLVAVAVAGTRAAVVEVNSETDFVARNEAFQSLVRSVAGAAVENGGDRDRTAAATFPGKSHSVEDEVRERVATIGENMTFRRSADQVDPAVVERERAIFAEQARESGKPANVIEKMVEGRIRKFYEESTLLKQAFVINPDQTVEEAVKAAEASVGAPITVTAFVRFALGEGIEREETDFAAEVAAAAGQG